jgi:hypothetical protein
MHRFSFNPDDASRRRFDPKRWVPAPRPAVPDAEAPDPFNDEPFSLLAGAVQWASMLIANGDPAVADHQRDADERGIMLITAIVYFLLTPEKGEPRPDFEVFHHERELASPLYLPDNVVAVRAAGCIVGPDGAFLEWGAGECEAGQWLYRPKRTFYAAVPNPVFFAMTVGPKSR